MENERFKLTTEEEKKMIKEGAYVVFSEDKGYLYIGFDGGHAQNLATREEGTSLYCNGARLD